MKNYTEINLADGNMDDYSEGEIEAAVFLSKLDWEGGVDGLWNYGGERVFPKEIQPEAIAYGIAFEELHRAIRDWAGDRGVRY